MNKPKVLITGAGGFVGRNLIPFLVKEGYPIIALDQRAMKWGRNSKKIKSVVADLSEIGQWQKEIKGVSVVVHLAAQISSKYPQDFEKNNTEATKKLLIALKKTRVKKIILFSSAAVTSIRKDPYSLTKEAQENLVRKSGIPYVMIRPSMMYGPLDDKNIGWLIKVVKMMPVIPLPGGGNFGRQPVYIGDICQIVEKLISKKYPKRIYEIHGQDYITMKEMVRTIRDELGSFKPLVPIPAALLFWTFFIGERVLSNPKFTSDQISSLTSGEKFKGDKWWKTFDIEATKFETGVSRMIER
jgi:nucleoside-diphosphate-sugar epimerase